MANATKTVKKAVADPKMKSLWLGFDLAGNSIEDYNFEENRKYLSNYDYLIEIVIPVAPSEPKITGRIVLERK